MRREAKVLCMLAACCIASVFIAGCEDDETREEPATNVSGIWRFRGSAGELGDWTLAQTSGRIVGSLVGGYVSSAFAGTLEGNALTFSMRMPNGTHVVGEGVVNGNRMVNSTYMWGTAADHRGEIVWDAVRR